VRGERPVRGPGRARRLGRMGQIHPWATL
jgi:hypothetical protein